MDRKDVLKFYGPKKIKSKRKSKDIVQSTITKSLRRLIKRGFIYGLGYATPREFIVQKVRLTEKGVKLVKSLLSVRPLPLKL